MAAGSDRDTGLPNAAHEPSLPDSVYPDDTPAGHGFCRSGAVSEPKPLPGLEAATSHSALLDLALQASPIGTWYYRVEAAGCRDFWWSEQTCAILGISPQDPLPNSIRFWRRVIHRADHRAVIRWLRRLHGSAGPRSEIRFRIHAAGRQARHILVEAQSHEEGPADLDRILVAGTVRDVSNEWETGAQLLDERRRFRQLVEHSQDGVVLVHEGRMVSVNRAFADPIGYTVSELSGVDYRRLVAPEDRPRVERYYIDRISGEDPPGVYDVRLLHKDGVTRVPVRMSVGVADTNDAPVTIATVKYLTSTAASTRAPTCLANHAPVGIALVQRRRIVLINPAFTRVLGYSATDLETLDSISLLHPEDRPRFSVQSSDVSLVCSVRVLHKDGTYRLLDINIARTVHDGRPGVTLVCSEAADRSQENVQARSAEWSLLSLIESSPLPIFLKDQALRYTYINKRARKVFGLPGHSVAGKRDDALLHGAEAARWIEADRQALNGDRVTSEHVIGTGSNRSFHAVHRFPLHDGSGRVIGVGGIGIDETEVRRLKQIMSDMSQVFGGVLETVPAGVLIVEPTRARHGDTEVCDYRIRQANLAAQTMLGFTLESSTTVLLSGLFPGSWQYGLAKRIDAVVSTGHGTTFEQVVSLNGAASQWMSVSINRIHDRVAIALSDTTSSRQALDALRRSERNFREIFDCSTNAILVHNAATGEIVDVNNAVCEMLGGRREDLLRLTIEDISAGGEHYSQEQAVHMVRRAFEQGRHSFEWRARRLDGDEFWIEVTLVRAVINGESAVLAFANDITDRKRAEGGLTASEGRFRAVFEHSGIGILLAHGDGSILRTNPAFCQFGGYDEQETNELNIMDLLHRSDQRRFDRQIGRLRKQVRPRVQLHVRLRRRDRSYFWAGVTASLLPGSNDDTPSSPSEPLVLYMITDISAQRRAEAVLRETEEEFRALAESIPHLVWSLNAAGLPSYCNSRVLEYYGTAGGQIDLPEWQVHLHPDDATTQRPAWKRCLSSGQEYVAECRLLRASDQSYRWQLVRFVPVRNAGGEVKGWFGTSTDVHDARDARERVEELVELERGLRRELDHRVRNNLTSLITLIDLAGQTARTADECAGSIRARTQTMATIHSLLTRSSDRTVELRAILIAFVPCDCRGTIDIRGPEVRLNPSQADKVGLITNELMSNSLAYGALGVRGGTVAIQWHIEQQHDSVPEVCIWWRETGGTRQPSTAVPGSGTKIIEGLVRFDLNGVVDLRYPPEGANHHLRFRLEPVALGAISL